MTAKSYSGLRSTPDISSSHQQSRPSFICTLVPTRLTTMHVLTSGQSVRASSASRFSGISLPPLKPPSAVISILAPQSFMRLLSEAALYPPKTTLWITPMRAQASMAIGSSGTMGRYIATLSPFLTPWPFSTVANLQTSRWSNW